MVNKQPEVKIKLHKGDLVVLARYLIPTQTLDAFKREYYEATVTYSPSKTQIRTLFGASTGVYIGSEYVVKQDKRSHSGVVNELRQVFYFGGRKIYVDQIYVHVICSLAK